MGAGETVTAAWEALRAAHAALSAPWGGGGCCKGGRDEENLIGRKEARFQRGLNPTQRSLGFIQ